MTRKIPKTVHIRQSLLRYAMRRVESDEAPYKHLSEYLNALIIWDRTVGLPHHVLSDLMAKPDRIRDRIIEKLADETELPPWMRDKLTEMIEKACEEQCESCDLKKNGCGQLADSALTGATKTRGSGHDLA
jgi:hypothetical protein